MIKSITAENPKGEKLVLELSNPEPSGLYVKSVEGLGPGKSTINVNEIMSSDGGIYSSSRVSSRNIILTLGMMFCPLIEDARHKTYQYFQIKKKVKLTIETDYRISFIEGFVESNEPDIFSEEETAQISIICPNPWFYDMGGTKSAFSGVEDLFEFPFSNELLPGDVANNTCDHIIFGDIRQGTVVGLQYDGDIDTGVLMRIRFTDIMDKMVIYNVDTSESMTLNLTLIKDITGSALTIHDEIEISTFTGSKYIYLVREGEKINIFSVLDRFTSWFKLSKGVNQFAFTASGHEEAVIVEFTYKNMYGGI